MIKSPRENLKAHKWSEEQPVSLFNFVFDA